MSIIRKMRRQKAIYWERDEPDHYGKFSFKEPIQIACRWENGSKEFRTGEGEALTFSATVYVDRAMKIGDMLKFGELDSTVPTDPSQDPDADTIQRFESIPNLKATETLYTVYL